MTKTDTAAIAQFIEELGMLAADQPTGKDSLKDWNARAQKIVDRWKTDPQLRDLAIEEHIWHWLSDADIRIKDSEYARLQNEGFEHCLAEMRRAHAT